MSVVQQVLSSGYEDRLLARSAPGAARDYLRLKRVIVVGCVLAACTASAWPQQQFFVIESATLTEVAVNGGADTANPGTTCIKIAEAVDTACTAGYMALPNNNRLLIAAALQSKATKTPARIYMVAGSPSFHCPGLVLTPCNVISLTVK